MTCSVAILFLTCATVPVHASHTQYTGRSPRFGLFDWLKLKQLANEDVGNRGVESDAYEQEYTSLRVDPNAVMEDELVISKMVQGMEYPNGNLGDTQSTYVTKRRPSSPKKETSNSRRERFYISRFQTKYFPYSNIVHLSAGCTGTLLTPYHVLTAAHCVHNGNRYKRNIEMLKVEVPEIIGSRLYYVVEMKVPALWMKMQTFPEAAKGAYDYAILKLNLPVRGRKTFMQMSLPKMSALSSDLHLLSFGSDRSHSLLQSTCRPDRNLIVMNGNVLLTACEATHRGSSGSAVFTTNGREGERILGVLSNTITTISGNVEFDAVMLLTLQKCLDICTMIQPEGAIYNSCDDIKQGKVQRKIGRRRNMPIFG